MLLLWFVLISTVKKRCLACATEISMIVSMFLFLLRCTLDVFATEKRVNHGGGYGMKIPAIFLLNGPGKIIKLSKDEIIKIKENLKETVKQCLK